MGHTLFTYRNLKELRKIQEEREVFAFIFGETKDMLLEMAKTKYSDQFAKIEITEDDKKQLYAFDYSSLSALRDIKRVFNNRLMDYFVEKGVL